MNTRGFPPGAGTAAARHPRRALLIGVGMLAAIALTMLLLWRFGPWRGGAQAPDDLTLHAVGAYRIGVATTPDPPRVGENEFTIVLRDAQDRPVRGATLAPVVSMPAMGAMPYMESRGVVREAGPGLYRARYGLSMGGEWDVRIPINAGAGVAEANFRLSTSLTGVAFDTGTLAVGGATGSRPVSTGAGADAESSAAAGTLPGMITLDASRRQVLGVRTAVIGSRDLSLRLRSSGRVSYDESRQVDVSLKYAGWVRGIAADFTGRPVRRGEVLFTAYSPDLVAAQQEYLQSLGDPARDSVHAGMNMGHENLAAAARQRLLRWDVPAGTLDDLVRTRRVREAVPVVAPETGVIVEKNVVDGSPFSAGQVLFRIAPVDPAWVIASVFQGDLARVQEGSPARITDPFGAPARRGRVSFIYPAIQSDTRAGQVRIDVPNADGALKPGTFVDVEIDAPLGRRLAVPESAVLPTGERTVVFVDLGDGRIAPRTVELGARSGDWYEVRSGLKAGDVVVTSGNFLIAAESKLRSAEGQW